MKNDGGTEHRDQPGPAAQDAVPTASADIDSPRAQDLDAIMPHGATTAPGRYGKAHEYARGGIGRILLVHGQYLDRDIAMKELLSATGPDAATMDQGESPSSARVIRFLREARVTGQLEHPSIVPVHELGRRQDGTLYYTMKLVHGRTLQQAIDDADGLSQRLELLPHFLDLCQAIAYAHSRGVVHRDIKTSNVMIGEFGETVVIDWGLAKVKGMRQGEPAELEANLETNLETNLEASLEANLEASLEANLEASLEANLEASTQEVPGGATGGAEEPDEGLTLAGDSLGTPHYMSPEQAMGNLDEVAEPFRHLQLGGRAVRTPDPEAPL